MQRMSQRFFAAIAAILSVAGLASAQNTPPNPYPLNSYPNPYPLNSYPLIQPVQAVPVTQQPPGVQVNPTPGAVALPGSVGCSSCGRGVPGTYPSPYLPPPQKIALGAGLAPVPYNEYCPQCANGCGSVKSDIGFIFGSCKSFFNPCGPIPYNGFGHCGVYPYGKPYATGFNGCTYTSYLDH